MTTLPKSVPALRASKLLRGPYRDLKRPGCGCLMFHADLALGSQYCRAIQDFHDAITTTSGQCFPFTTFNKTAPKAEQVKAYHAAWVLLGYRRRGSRFVYVGKPTPRRPRRRGRG